MIGARGRAATLRTVRLVAGFFLATAPALAAVILIGGDAPMPG